MTEDLNIVSCVACSGLWSHDSHDSADPDPAPTHDLGSLILVPSSGLGSALPAE